MELALYNNILSGIGLDGRCFFYDNPMASHGSHQRIDWPWWTPCCPPNLARLVSSLSGYLYSQSADAIGIHHYISSEVVANDFQFAVRSGLPFSEDNSIEVKVEAPTEKTLLFRIPAWSGGYTVSLNGETIAPVVNQGYAEIRRVWNSGETVVLNFNMPVKKKFSRYEVDENRGRLALTRGPLVYCLEQIDNGPELDAVTIPADAEISPQERSDLLDGLIVLTGPAIRERTSADALYAEKPPATEQIRATAIPYFAWNNRGPGETLVWVRRAVH